mgnify:CR=1 FL=1
MQTKDGLDLQRFFDMQEQPEKYTDEELEAMMDEIDQMPDLEDEWQKMMEREQGAVKSEPLTRRSQKIATATRFQRWASKVAAIFIGILFVSGIAFAAIHFMNRSHGDAASHLSPSNSQRSTADVQQSSSVHFDNVPLDSVLTVVSAHYRKVVQFRDEAPRRVKLIMTWQPDAPLADFLDRLNAFDGLSIRLENDTIFVMQMSGEEGKR